MLPILDLRSKNCFCFIFSEEKVKGFLTLFCYDKAGARSEAVRGCGRKLAPRSHRRDPSPERKSQGQRTGGTFSSYKANDLSRCIRIVKVPTCLGQGELKSSRTDWTISFRSSVRLSNICWRTSTCVHERHSLLCRLGFKRYIPPFLPGSVHRS